MELRHLRYFMAAAEEEHFGRAAERLHVTRPAVSKLIADLESELETPLFERLAHGVKLTDAGHALLPMLKMAMTELNDAFSVAKRVGQGKRGSLSIGYGSLTLLHPMFRAAVKQFRQTCPDVTLTLVEAPSSEQFKVLASGKIHAGFMHLSPRAAVLRKHRSADALAQDEILLDWFRIQTCGLGVAVPSDHRLANRKLVAMEELAGEPFIVVPGSSRSPAFGLPHDLCQKAGFEPQIVQEVSTVTSQLNLITVGMGIALMPTGRDFLYPSSVSVIPLEHVSYSTSFVLGWVKGMRSAALDHMIEIVRTLANKPRQAKGA
ncbi:Hca operon transcriptional activator (plasmid) [Variovorax sp. SRS16]|uniref:LysR substrate-binding domain-containing protein n=1 Tax=Variovorax sp. SRS16 TaxID=282217 RepID=UPI0013188A9F|nr:LysR substrate-binding domain-containing protein [Variovorax sp. SRS16]VTU45310.1 Hca operon transcriptional activator [Variovorax sp. SRS16]